MNPIAYQIFHTVWQVFNVVLIAFAGTVSVYLIILLIKVLRKYLQSSNPGSEKSIIKKSLGEIIKEYRMNCNMTQEFVAESLGVSRQAVSKWESGVTSPSTSNLFALAKLFNVSAEELNLPRSIRRSISRYPASAQYISDLCSR